MAFNPLTPLETATLDHIRTFTTDELHVYVSEDGLTVLDVTINPALGGPLSLKIGTMLAAGQKVRLLHNHPSEDSLSSSDWETLAHHHGLLEMVVVTPNGSIYRGKVDYDFQAGQLLSVVKQANAAYTTMHSMIKVPNVSMRNPSLLSDTGRLPNVFIGQRFYELGIVDFGAWFSTPDQYAIADLQHEPIRHMWSAFLRRTWP
ncbi:hypothetical protein [Rhizobium pisi]|uniref:hypothetical protein n=1 Tax=Rhizobium pisi TaxID=574561 RepID=UPI003D08C5B2